MEYQFWMFISAWIILGIAVVVIAIRQYKKEANPKGKTCPSCNGMGFTWGINPAPPPCMKCGGTGYI